MKELTFTLQAYYCCYEDLLREITQKYPNANYEVSFMGNSRTHHPDCEKMKKRSENSTDRNGFDSFGI